MQGSIVSTEENEGATFAGDEGEKGRVVVALIESSNDEHHWCGLSIECNVAGIDIRSFRVVDIVHTIKSAYTFETVCHT